MEAKRVLPTDGPFYLFWQAGITTTNIK